MQVVSKCWVAAAGKWEYGGGRGRCLENDHHCMIKLRLQEDHKLVENGTVGYLKLFRKERHIHVLSQFVGSKSRVGEQGDEDAIDGSDFVAGTKGCLH